MEAATVSKYFPVDCSSAEEQTKHDDGCLKLIWLIKIDIWKKIWLTTWTFICRRSHYRCIPSLTNQRRTGNNTSCRSSTTNHPTKPRKQMRMFLILTFNLCSQNLHNFIHIFNEQLFSQTNFYTVFFSWKWNFPSMKNVQAVEVFVSRLMHIIVVLFKVMQAILLFLSC